MWVCVSLKSFSLPKPTRGSYSYRDISECSLSFPGQPSKSGLLSLKFKKTCQVDVCASLIAICCRLFYFFFLSMPLLITVWTSTPFPSSGNSFVMLSLRTLGVHGVCLASVCSQRHLSVNVQMLMNDSEVCSVTENS